MAHSSARASSHFSYSSSRNAPCASFKSASSIIVVAFLRMIRRADLIQLPRLRWRAFPTRPKERTPQKRMTRVRVLRKQLIQQFLRWFSYEKVRTQLLQLVRNLKLLLHDLSAP